MTLVFSIFSDPNGQNDTEPLLKGVRWEPATLENPQKHIVIDKESSLQEVFKVGKFKLILKIGRSTKGFAIVI